MKSPLCKVFSLSPLTQYILVPSGKLTEERIIIYYGRVQRKPTLQQGLTPHLPNFVCGGCRGRVETTQKGAKHVQQKHQSGWRQNCSSCIHQQCPTRIFPQTSPHLGGTTSPLPATPSRNRTKRQKSIHSQKQHNTAIKFLLFLGPLP